MSVKLRDILPAPSGVSDDWAQRDPWFKHHDPQQSEPSTAVTTREPPPYGHRRGYVPRSELDFGDGGAFPEIHMAQYPLSMGWGDRKAKGNTLTLQVDAEGKVNYDAIARVGADKDKVIFTKLSDMKGVAIDDNDTSYNKPDEEEVMNITEATRNQLEQITSHKISAALPVRHAEKQAPAQYIRYTPSQQGSQFNSGAQQRIIRMVEAQVDPMEPPKFKINGKIPRPPPSPPAPVMHSPTRKVSVKEQAEWKIPPCISNWKNPKGYTIPLDKRLAADGRGLQQVHVNENFSKLAEALYIADRKSREAVEMRAQLEKKLAQKKKEEEEEKMRALAAKAREERAGIRRTKNEDEQEKERDELRRDRQNDRRRDRNIARAAPDKQAKLRRDKDRDISEKIAPRTKAQHSCVFCCAAVCCGAKRRFRLQRRTNRLPDAKSRSDETQFDQRLFNQSRGLDAGGGLDDETYAVYDKPWAGNNPTAQHIYRPKKNADKDIYGDDLDKIIKTSKFVADRGFDGATESTGSRREGPVQFEKDVEDDPFGLGQLLKTAKEGGKKRKDEEGRSDRKDEKRSRK